MSTDTPSHAGIPSQSILVGESVIGVDHEVDVLWQRILFSQELPRVLIELGRRPRGRRAEPALHRLRTCWHSRRSHAPAAHNRDIGSLDIIAVLADDTDRSSVLRGENSGRALSHVAVARTLLRVGKLQATAQQTVQIPVPSSIRTTAGHHLILFAQEPGNGPILGADSRPL